MYFHHSLIPRGAYFLLSLESKQEATSGWNFTKCISEVKVNQLKVKNIHVKMGTSIFKRTCKMDMCISKGTPFSIPPHDRWWWCRASADYFHPLSHHNVYSASKQSRFMMQPPSFPLPSLSWILHQDVSCRVGSLETSVDRRAVITAWRKDTRPGSEKQLGVIGNKYNVI